MNALASPEVGKYINEYFAASFQKVATFRIVGDQKQGLTVESIRREDGTCARTLPAAAR